MSTVDALVCLVAFLMIMWAVEANRAERALEHADLLAAENDRLRADLEATRLTDEEWDRQLAEAESNIVAFPPRLRSIDGNGGAA